MSTELTTERKIDKTMNKLVRCGIMEAKPGKKSMIRFSPCFDSYIEFYRSRNMAAGELFTTGHFEQIVSSWNISGALLSETDVKIGYHIFMGRAELDAADALK